MTEMQKKETLDVNIGSKRKVLHFRITSLWKSEEWGGNHIINVCSGLLKSLATEVLGLQELRSGKLNMLL